MSSRRPFLNFEPPDSLKLPTGKSCEDCRRVERCKIHLGISGHETSCDYDPSRYTVAPRNPGAMLVEAQTQRARQADRAPKPCVECGNPGPCGCVDRSQQ